MKSGGYKVETKTVDITQAGLDLFKSVTNVKDFADAGKVLESAGVAASGFVSDAQAVFRGIAGGLSSGIAGAARFADKAQVSSDAKGSTPRVATMFAALMKSDMNVGSVALAEIIHQIAS